MVVARTASVSGDQSAGRKLVLGLRPEHLTRADQSLAAKIKVVEPLGSKTLVQAELDGRDMTVLLKERYAAEIGDILHLGLDDAPQFLFDPETEQRV